MCNTRNVSVLSQAKMTQLTRTVTQVRKKQKMLRSKVLWDDVTIGRHHHFDNPETEWTLEVRPAG